MEKWISCGTLFFLLIVTAHSNAEMRITPGDMTFSSSSTILTGSANTGSSIHSSEGGIISVSNSYSGLNQCYGGYFEAQARNGSGVFGTSGGASAKGVQGYAWNLGNVSNYGGHFMANGEQGRGVYGYAYNSYGNVNYGGYFQADGIEGRGIYAVVVGNKGRGVFGNAINSGDVENYGGYFRANGEKGIGVYGLAASHSQGKNYGGYFSANSNFGVGAYGHATGINGIGVRGIGPNYGGYFESSRTDKGTAVGGTTSGTNSTSVYGYATGGDSEGVKGVAYGPNSKGVEGVGTQYDFYASGPGTNYGPFTGGHEVKFEESMARNVMPGLIVSATGKTQTRMNEKGEISISSTLPTVALSNQPMDKAVFGAVVSEGPLPRGHWYESQESERFGVINALGEGRVWVTNLNGNVRTGDYITTSKIPGYGQMQDDDVLHSYTLGKAIETVDWEQVTETVSHGGETYKRYLIAIVYTSG